MKDKLEIIIFNIFKTFVLFLPIRGRYRFAEICGLIIYYLLGSRRKLTLKNILLAFPDKNQKEIKKIALNSYKNISKTFFEMLWADKLNVEVEGMENFNQACKQEKGVILVSLHIGNWESGGMEIAKNGYPIYPIAKAQRNKLFNEKLNSERAKNGVFVIKKGATSSPRAIIKALKSKGALGLICDQYSTDLKIKFFNSDTWVTAGPASLALKFDVPIILAYDIRINNQYHKLIIEPEIVIDKSKTDEENIKNGMQKIFDRFEKIIKENPEQWFWQHKRWR